MVAREALISESLCLLDCFLEPERIFWIEGGLCSTEEDHPIFSSVIVMLLKLSHARVEVRATFEALEWKYYHSPPNTVVRGE